MPKPKQFQGSYETVFYDEFGSRLHSYISTTYLKAKELGDKQDAYSYIVKLIMFNSLEPKVTKRDYHE